MASTLFLGFMLTVLLANLLCLQKALSCMSIPKITVEQSASFCYLVFIQTKENYLADLFGLLLLREFISSPLGIIAHKVFPRDYKSIHNLQSVCHSIHLYR